MSRRDQLHAQERELTLELERVKRLRREKLDDHTDPSAGQILANLAIEITRLTSHLEACRGELADGDRPMAV
jgi:hypothetical protein